jgi:hypothetical protein
MLCFVRTRNFVVVHNILTEGVFVTQLRSDVGNISLTTDAVFLREVTSL